MIRKLFYTIISCTILPSLASAMEFETGGIFYQTIDNTANVRVIAPVETAQSEKEETSESTPIEEYRGSITIPTTVKFKDISYTVTEIGPKAFAGSTTVTSIILPESLSAIGEYAFYMASAIEEVKIPGNVSEIGRNAFSGCSKLQTITIPENIGIIRSQTFYNCSSLVSVFFNPDIEEIGQGAFAGCTNLRDISTTNNLSKIGDSAFLNCSSLESFRLPGTLSEVGTSVFQGCSSLKNVMWEVEISTVPDYLFSGCVSLLPFELPGSILEIGEYAFENCHALDTIINGNNIRTINRGAFSGCKSLRYLHIASMDMEIGDFAFSECSSLKMVSLRGVSYVGKDTFANNLTLESVAFYEEMKTISSRAFLNCPSLKTVYSYRELPPSLTNTSFETQTYEHATLYVHPGDRLLYMQTPPWSYFMNVEESELDPDSVSVVTDYPAIAVRVEGDELVINGMIGTPVMVYTLNGRMVFNSKMESESIRLPLNERTLYLVNGANYTHKVLY